MQYRGQTLTSEQEKNILQIIEGGDYAIQAPPGSGKTFLLKALSRKLKGTGLNVSFNKALAIQASQEFPRHVLCKTGHAIAYGAVGWKFQKRLKKITGASLANNYYIGKTNFFKSPPYKGYLILATIRQYCYSSDKEINIDHVPHIPYSEELKLEELQNDLIDSSKVILSKMFDESSDIPITHDIYLKKWSLTNPVLGKDFILFDEYQDANPVISQVIKNQNCQKIFVGDQYQQIYSWRGAVNALNDSDFSTLYITQSFRFGNAIANMANKIINSYYPTSWNYRAFMGHSDIDSSISYTPIHKVDCIICRTNNGVINETIKTQKAGFKVHILGEVQQLISLINGIHDLKQLGKSYHPELFLFNSYDDLLEYAKTSFGSDLSPIIKIIDKHGRRKLIELLNQTEGIETNADVTITTAHKSKGLEWPIVRLANDFKYPEDGQLPTLEETNILYVAATRALHTLDLSHCMAMHPAMLNEAKKINKEQDVLMKNLFLVK